MMKKMKIFDLFKETGIKFDYLKFKNKIITGIEDASDKVEKNNLFVCIKGNSNDGHNYVNEAIKNGAEIIVGEKKLKLKKAIYIRVKNSKQTLLKLVEKFYNDIIKKAKIIGITGTKGKTTVSYLIDSLLKEQFKKPNSIIGTIKYIIGNKQYNADTTTPSLVRINKLIAESVNKNINDIIIEMSSHALHQGRVNNLKIDKAVITNIKRDHLDYHKTFNGYFSAKMKILDLIKKDGLVILNIDDEHSHRIIKQIKNRRLNYITYSINEKADINLLSYKSDIYGSKGELNIFNKKIIFDTPLIGLHNIYNIMAAIGAVIDRVNIKTIKKVLKNFSTVKGRLEKIYDKDFFVFVDYAHTPDSMEKVLDTLNKIKTGKIITVFGAGGNRDKGKRPLMGKVAEKLSDVVIITSDNPRFENPDNIIRDILKGIKREKNIFVEPDRKKAIKFAIRIAEKKDIVVLFGKGHEKYQIIKDKKIKFSDEKIALSEIKKREEIWN